MQLHRINKNASQIVSRFPTIGSVISNCRCNIWWSLRMMIMVKRTIFGKSVLGCRDWAELRNDGRALWSPNECPSKSMWQFRHSITKYQTPVTDSDTVCLYKMILVVTKDSQCTTDCTSFDLGDVLALFSSHICSR